MNRYLLDTGISQDFINDRRVAWQLLFERSGSRVWSTVRRIATHRSVDAANRYSNRSNCHDSWQLHGCFQRQ